MSQISPIPDKKYFRVNEVCQVTDTQPYVLRFWESEFPQLAPEAKGGGQRMYRRQDVALVMRIKQLLYDEEYTLEGARARIEEELTDEGGSSAKKAAKKASKARPKKSAKQPEPPVEEPIPEDRPLDFDGASTPMVARDRYDDAVEEIAHLRLKLQEAETKLRKSDGLRQESEQRAAHHQARSEKLIARFERLLGILESG